MGGSWGPGSLKGKQGQWVQFYIYKTFSKSKNKENAFYKHWHNFHETPCEDDSARLQNFEIRVENSFKDPMSRQINEMVRIMNFNGTLLNSKSEWNAPPIIRIRAENESERK